MHVVHGGGFGYRYLGRCQAYEATAVVHNTTLVMSCVHKLSSIFENNDYGS